MSSASRDGSPQRGLALLKRDRPVAILNLKLLSAFRRKKENGRFGQNCQGKATNKEVPVFLLQSMVWPYSCHSAYPYHTSPFVRSRFYSSSSSGSLSSSVLHRRFVSGLLCVSLFAWAAPPLQSTAVYSTEPTPTGPLHALDSTVLTDLYLRVVLP